MARKKGWEKEPARHSLAARGHKTASVKTMKGMFNAADGSNVTVACRHCSSKLYPSAGKYTEDEIRKAGLVKVRFYVPKDMDKGPSDEEANDWAQRHYGMSWNDIGSRGMDMFFKEWESTPSGMTESMWVRVERVEDGKVHGRLDNDPIAVDMKFNDPVEVPTDAVVQVWDLEYEKRLKKAAEEAEREKRL